MKIEERLPLPLDSIIEDLNEMGLVGMVHGAKVDYDNRIKGTDVTLTLKVRFNDINKERDTSNDDYERAMTVVLE